MKNHREPLVCVLTPVYNGERYIRECIESVLRQTYSNWRYIIVNNKSTDQTRAIAESFAEKDTRISVQNPEEFLKAMQNWNRTLRQIPQEAKYCKFVHADDFLFPECIEKMVEVAENNPSVGIVGSYRLRGPQIYCSGISYPKRVVSGKEVCRMTLMGKIYVFGTPTNILFKTEVINGNDKFYDEDLIHSDVDVAYSILKDYDFGFVHQILTFSRLHEESHTSTVAYRYATNDIEYIYMIKKHGPRFFTKEEYIELESIALKQYYKFLARRLLRGRQKELLPYHEKIMNIIDMKISRKKLMFAILSVITDKVFNPKETILNMLNKKTQL